MYATGNDPMSRVHWFTFAEISVAIAIAPLPLAAKMVAMMNSGASDASGAATGPAGNDRYRAACRHRSGCRQTVLRT